VAQFQLRCRQEEEQREWPNGVQYKWLSERGSWVEGSVTSGTSKVGVTFKRLQHPSNGKLGTLTENLVIILEEVMVVIIG
jgi:hypothetical protein